jgi:hypothetical protein
VRGVEDAARRYETDAADSFDLGESFDLIAFGGDHTAYEAPPLEQGRRLRAAGEAEVGIGLADALGLRPGAVLAAQLPDGRETRYRVVGVVRALQQQGRVAWVGGRLPGPPQLAIRLKPGASADRVQAELARVRGTGFATSAAGVEGEAVRGWAARNGGFVSILVALLRAVAVIDALVCLYALAQVLALTAEERRGAVAVVRAVGGSPRQVLALFAGSALTLALLAAPLGLALERLVVGPRVAALAASYATLSLRAGTVSAAIVAAGLAVAALVAAAAVARAAVREPVVAGLQR